MGRKFKAEICKNWDEFISLRNSPHYNWASTPFQTGRWMQSWLDTIGDNLRIKAQPIIIYESITNQPVMLLPLILNSKDKIHKIEPADLGLSDYNAPIIAPSLSLNKQDMTQIWQAIKAVLPPHDMLLITKIPEKIEGKVNPLYTLKSADKSPLNGNILNIITPWHEYHWGLERTFRKEIERSWRVFEKHSLACFKNVTDTNKAMKIMLKLENQQAARMAEIGADYILDRPDITAFYRNLLKNGILNQTVRLTALIVEDEIVAALLGVVNGTTFSMVRLSTGDKKWRNCSPGRLLIYKTMEHMHAQNFCSFDFTIGDYNYKRRMGAEFIPLCNIVESGNLFHIPHTFILRLRFWLQLSPTWRRFKDWQKLRRHRG